MFREHRLLDQFQMLHVFLMLDLITSRSIMRWSAGCRVYYSCLQSDSSFFLQQLEKTPTIFCLHAGLGITGMLHNPPISAVARGRLGLPAKMPGPTHTVTYKKSCFFKGELSNCKELHAYLQFEISRILQWYVLAFYRAFLHPC